MVEQKWHFYSKLVEFGFIALSLNFGIIPSVIENTESGYVEQAPTGILHWMPVLLGCFGVTSNWNDILHLCNFILESNKCCDVFAILEVVINE